MSKRLAPIDSAIVPSTNERVTGAFVKDMVVGVGVLTGKRSRYRDIFQAQVAVGESEWPTKGD
jgi:hypothetical protein